MIFVRRPLHRKLKEPIVQAHKVKRTRPLRTRPSKGRLFARTTMPKPNRTPSIGLGVLYDSSRSTQKESTSQHGHRSAPISLPPFESNGVYRPRGCRP